jgi:hypothetical protein
VTDAEATELLRVPFTFTRRPVSIAADLRPLWRISIICLILQHCRMTAATLVQLHVLNWALRDQTTRAAFLDALRGGLTDAPIVRIDPSLNRAVDLAIGEGLVNRSSQGRLVLGQRGATLAQRVLSDDAIFVDEKAFFEEVGGKISGAMIDRLVPGSASR